jgi:hypothetical protein
MVGTPPDASRPAALPTLRTVRGHLPFVTPLTI